MLRTASLYGWRTIKGLRHILRDGTAGGKVEIINFKGLRHFVRDGTAGGRELTEEYNYSLSIRLRSVFIFFP